VKNHEEEEEELDVSRACRQHIESV